MVALNLPDSDQNALLDHLLICVSQSIQQLPDNSTICVGLSGGLDSVVLLDILIRLQQQHSYRLTACHVHHGISANADTWMAFCDDLCKKNHIPLSKICVPPLKTIQKGLEKAAREARYGALANQSAHIIALAHHQDDQAETVLLQLCRGAGVAGLSAIWPRSLLAGTQKILWRPLLDIPRSTLLHWANHYKLLWMEDESNLDTVHRRNAIRHTVLPTLRTLWPAASQKIAQTAQICQESLILLNELAEIDGKSILCTSHSLDFIALRALSEIRGLNLLRYWLTKIVSLSIPSQSRLKELYRQLITLSATATGQMCFSGKHLGWHHGRIFAIFSQPTIPYRIPYQEEQSLPLPDGTGILCFQRVWGKGIKASVMNSGEAVFCNHYRQQEKIRASLIRPRRTLKQLFQEHHIPFWQRKTWPLLYYQDRLVAVLNLATDPDICASENEAGILISQQTIPKEILLCC